MAVAQTAIHENRSYPGIDVLATPRGSLPEWHHQSKCRYDGQWYRIRIVFNSDKSDIVGSNGTRVDIFIDDEGTDGSGIVENWADYINASKTINDSSPCKWGALPGDYLWTPGRDFYIGDNWSHTDNTGNCGMFKAKIDWVNWKPYADYVGVDESPH